MVQPAAAVTFVSSNVLTNTTWTTAGDGTYEVVADITVAAGATLTIQPGVTVRFAHYASLWVDGTLNAAGTAGSKITFTGTSATKGWWRGVLVRNAGSAALTYCELAYAGYYDNLSLSKSGSGSLSLTNSIIRDSSDRALVVSSGYSSFVSANNQFNNNVTACVIGINASFDDSTSDFSNNTGANVYLNGGTMNQNTTWNLKPAYSFYVSSGITVEAAATLTVKPGTVVKFGQYHYLNVVGTLVAQGTSSDKIHFTDWRDDTVGGDGNKNGAADGPAAGWWKNIRILDPGTATLGWCEMAYAGYYDSICLWKSGGGDFSMTHTKVRNSSGYGLYLSGSSGLNTLTNDTFTGNAASGMYLNASAVTVTGSTFNGNAAYGLLHEINDTIVYPDNTFTGNAAGSVGVNGGTLSKDLTWTHGIDMELRSDTTVAAGKALTVERGVRVSFAHYAGLWVDGILTAPGTALEPVRFTGTSATKGWWRGVLVRNAGSAALTHCEMAYAGYYDNLTLSKSGSGSLSLTHSVIRDSSDRGLVVSSGYSSFISANNQFNNNVTACQIGINATFDDNTSDFSNNTGANVYLDGGIVSQSTIWNLKPAYSFYVSGDISVAAAAILTVSQGTVVKFAQYSGIYVEGSIDAKGTSGSKIHFTDWRDDTVGGDANKNGDGNVPGAGWWRHIRLYNGGSGVFNWCEIAYTGYYNNVGLWKEGSGDFTLENTTARNGQGYGIYVSNSSGKNLFTNVTASNNSLSGMYINNSPASVTGSTFSSNGAYGLLHEFNDTITYPDNTFANNAGGSVGIKGGTLGKSLTWTHGIDIVVESDMTVAAGSTLTIQPGVTVRFAHYASLWVDGTLNAAGTAGSKITFTGTSATKGWWRGVLVRNAGSAALTYCELAYAGYYDNLSLSKSGSGSLSLTHSTIRDSSDRGLVVSSGYSSFVSANNQFNNNVTACEIGINASFDDSTSDFSNNTGANVYLNGGTMNQNTTWNLKPAYSFYVSSGITVEAAATLTVKPGTVVKFGHYHYLNVVGALVAKGTSSNKIHFTDWRDDTVGGDGNKNGAADGPAAGWWKNIRILDPGTATLSWCEMAYAGYYDSICLWKSGGGDFSMTHTKVRNSSGYGLYLSDSSGLNTLTNDTFTGNAASGMYLNASVVTVTGSTFNGNAAYGLLHEINDTIVYPDNIFFSNAGGSVGVNGGTMIKDLTWTHGIDMVLRGDSSVAEGKKLTVERGVTVSAAHYVGLWVDGTLEALGMELAPVKFTGTSATKGWWRGICVRNAGSATLQSCEIAYGGYYDSMNVVKSGSGSLSITDSYSHDCAGDGLRISAGAAAFVSARNRYENSNFGCRIGVGASFDDNTSDFAGNAGPDVFLDGGTSQSNVTWSLKPDYSFYVSGDYTIAAGSTLTIKPGTVVKFEQYRSMGVAGALDAQGTPSGMIHFTDWRDDSVGGDANKNASANAPGANWWGHVHCYIAGSAVMNWCKLAYAGYYYNVGLWKEGSGDFTMQNSTVRDVRGDGLRINASTGNHVIARDTFSNNWNGVLVTNQTVALALGGCQFTDNTSQGTNSHGINNSSPGIVVDARGNWWGTDTGPKHASNPLGSGDSVTNNVLFDPWRRGQSTASILSPMRSGTLVAGDTLRFAGSAADHPGAGYVWNFGGGRTSGDRNPGLMGFPAAGAVQVTFAPIIGGQVDPFPDTRSLTVVADSGAFPDLRARQMAVPSSLAIGQTSRINYEVGNVGDAAVTGTTWKDSIYLSEDAYLDVGDIQLGSVTLTRTVAAGENYQGSINVKLPAVEEGSHFLILSVNDTWQVVERHRLNNELANSASVLIPGLAAGVTSSGTLEPRATADGHHYRFDLAEAGNLRLHFTGNVTVYVRTGGLAGTKDFMWQGTSGQDLLLGGLPAGSVFIHVSNNLTGSSTDYTMVAERADLLLSHVNPPQSAAGADLTLTVDGLGFAPDLSLTLVRGGTRVPATTGSLQVFSSRRLTVMFPGGSLTSGTYSLEAAGPGPAKVEFANAVTINPAGTPHLTLNLVVPDRLGYHGLGTLYVEYGNNGTAPMQAPFILLTSTQKGRRGAIMTLDSALVSQGFWTSAMPAGFATSIQLLGSGEVAGMLMPGEHRRVPVYYTGWLKPWDFAYPAFDFRVSALMSDDTRPVPWLTGEVLADDLRPTGMSDAAWAVVRDNLASGFGTTVGQFVSRLGKNAAYLENLGERTDNISKLAEFEVGKARGAFHPLTVIAANTDFEIGVPGDLPMLFARVYLHELGARLATTDLGQGWTHIWDYRLDTRTDGMKLLRQPGGALRIFAPDQRGGFISMPGDDAKLATVSGGHRLTEKDGNILRFDTDGRLVEMRDRLNHTVTLAYSGGLLTGLQHSGGAAFTLAHQSGRISSVTDQYGRRVNYTYNAQGQLATTTDPEGRETQYTYGISPEAAGSLVTVRHPSGVLKQFRYNALHSVNQTFTGEEGSATEVTQFTIDGARATLQDALNHRFSVAHDHRGLMRIVTDPSGRQSYFTFDRSLRNTAVLDGQGFGLRFQYDRTGNTSKITDATGIRSTFGYNGANFMTSHTDGAGLRFDYTRDAQGNLLRLQGPDGASWQWTYNADGRPATFKDKSGARQKYTWNAAGQLTAMADGGDTVIGQYVYDGSNRLSQLTTPSDSMRLTYTAGDRIQQVQSADGSQLDFGYDNAGRRTFVSSNKTGHRVNYHYDSAGRLQKLSDVSGTTIVEYTYDAAGKVSRKTFGNGVYTRYETDGYNRITHQSTHQADNAALSTFDLTYDSAGHLKSHVSDAGTWRMEYDVAGRVTHRTFTPAGSTSPNREETFTYDAAGELGRRTYNGTTYNIVRDAWGRVTSDGLYVYQYDADGNLVSRTGTGGTVAYTADHDGRVTSMSGSEGTTTITYDAAGALKTSTRAGENTLRWQLDPTGAGPLAILDESGSAVESYYQGLGMVAKDTASGRRFPEFDPVTGRQLFEISDSGAKLDTNQTPEPPVGLAIDSTSARAAMASSGPGDFGGPINGFGMEPVFPFGQSEIGLVIQAGKAVANIPHPAKVLSAVADVLRNDTFNFGSGALGIVTSGDVMDPLYRGVMRGGSMLHKGLNKLNVVVTDIPDPNGIVGRITQNASAFKKIGTGFGVLGVAGGGVEMVDAIFSGDKVNYDKLSHGFGTAALAGVGLYAATAAALPLAAPLVAVAGVLAFVSDNTLGLQERLCLYYYGLDPTGHHYVGQSVGSMDPNELIGPAGHGSANFRALVSAFAYRINFENDPSALAPAQIVTITNVLGTDLDRSAFTLTSVGFGDVVVPVGENTGNFFTSVDIVQDGLELEVEIDVSYNPATGRMVARFTTLDKATGLPPTVDHGFLPAEDGSGRGKGFVSYLVPPLPTLTTGTQVRNDAVINFDFAYDIATNQVDPHDASKGTDPNKEALVTIDVTAPGSALAPLPAAVVPNFRVNWSGSDGSDSGVASYTVYVSSDGGATWATWLENTTLTTAEFPGTAGKNYRFYVAAKDQVGNIQIVNSAAASVGTTVVGSAMITVQQPAGTTIPAGKGKVDFGKVKTGVAVTRSFTIRNNGPVELGNLAVKIEGSVAAAFVASAPQATSLATGAITTFTVSFSPTLAKTLAGVLRVTSNDPHIPTYDIALAGTGVAASKIEVKVTRGGTLADAKSVIDFGSAAVRKTGTTRTFTISNRGLAKLTKLAVSCNGTGKADFIITPLKVKSLAPGKSASFKVTFNPKTKGLRKATIHIKSDDSNIPSFDIALKGSAKAAKSSPPAGSIKSLLAQGSADPSDANVRSTTATIRINGQKFRCITIHKTGNADPVPASVEVSSNLVDWFAGKNHTTVIKDTAEILKVRDITPIESGKKRFIRLK